jgi:hypothetical protein
MNHYGTDHADELPEHDRGLSHDLTTLLSRRRALSIFGGAGLAAALAACGSGSETASTRATTGRSSNANTPNGSTTSSTKGSAVEIPEETAGPFPGDGSNGVNVLSESGIVRSDITTSFGSASGVAQGVPLTIKLKVLDTSHGAGALAGAAVYLWHCNIDGKYSLYSDFQPSQAPDLRVCPEAGSLVRRESARSPWRVASTAPTAVRVALVRVRPEVAVTVQRRRRARGASAGPARP